MNQQQYDILLNIIMALCGLLGMGFSLGSSNSSSWVIFLAIASYTQISSVVLYLSNAPKMIGELDSGNSDGVSRHLCLFAHRLSLFALTSQSFIILAIIIQARA